MARFAPGSASKRPGAEFGGLPEFSDFRRAGGSWRRVQNLPAARQAGPALRAGTCTPCRSRLACQAVGEGGVTCRLPD